MVLIALSRNEGSGDDSYKQIIFLHMPCYIIVLCILYSRERIKYAHM